ncbi:MAG: hypothetical protein GY943_12910, partial [Chloroflexi bacterium]|nr:hypothetical protein [Chloroflexota bacterium]
FTRKPLLELEEWQIYDQNIDERIDNILARCHFFDISGFGQIEECEALMQHGRYYMRLVIFIDGDVTTKDDWTQFLNVVQNRLVEHVAQES